MQEPGAQPALDLEPKLAFAATTRVGVLAQIEFALVVMQQGFEDDRVEARVLRNVMAALASPQLWRTVGDIVGVG